VPYTTPSTVTSSDVLTAALWNTQIRDNFETVAKPYSCRVNRSAVLSLPAGVDTNIPWNLADSWDYTGMHSPTVNPERITFPEAGIYMASAFFSVNGIGSDYVIRVRMNRYTSAGALVATFGMVSEFIPNFGRVLNLTGFVQANANDYMVVTALGVVTAGQAFGTSPVSGETYSMTVHQVSKQV